MADQPETRLEAIRLHTIALNEKINEDVIEHFAERAAWLACDGFYPPMWCLEQVMKLTMFGQEEELEAKWDVDLAANTIRPKDVRCRRMERFWKGESDDLREEDVRFYADNLMSMTYDEMLHAQLLTYSVMKRHVIGLVFCPLLEDVAPAALFDRTNLVRANLAYSKEHGFEPLECSNVR